MRDWKLRAEGPCLIVPKENEHVKEQVNAHRGSTYRMRPPTEGRACLSERTLEIPLWHKTAEGILSDG